MTIKMEIMEACEPKLTDGTTVKNKPDEFLESILKKKKLNLCWELPVPETCCCFPLRRGFLLLAYFKLVLSVVLFLLLLKFLILMYLIVSKEEQIYHGVAWTAMCINVVDIVIGIVIIVSTFKRNERFMEMYCKYSIYIFGLLSILFFTVFHYMYATIYASVILILLLVLVILMQIYLIQIVKSEVLKMKSTSQFQIPNNDQEPLCTFINNVNK